MCDFAAPAVLDRYAAAFRTRVERFQDSWPLCALADARCRSEHLEAEHRRQSLFHDSSAELSAHVPQRPWNSVIRESSNDRDFWKEELEDKVMDFRHGSGNGPEDGRAKWEQGRRAGQVEDSKGCNEEATRPCRR